jgi:hypothetical protein
MNFKNIQQWLDLVREDCFSDYEKIDIVITQLEDSSWRASLFNDGFQLLCNQGEKTMCAEAATFDDAVAGLNALCIDDVKDLV